MKVRWTKNGLRLRITPTELAAIAEGERVGETLHLPGGALWQVAVVPGHQTEPASEDNAAVLHLSDADRTHLAHPETEGIYFQSADGLRCVIEKDFPCVHPRGANAAEPRTETFLPPPDFEQRKNEAEGDLG